MSSRSQPPQQLAAREATERRQQARGLILLVLAALFFSLARFGFGRIFTMGWWRLW